MSTARLHVEATGKDVPMAMRAARANADRLLTVDVPYTLTDIRCEPELVRVIDGSVLTVRLTATALFDDDHLPTSSQEDTIRD